MFETMTTNGATILYLMVLGGSLVWILTYMYFSEGIQKRDRIIEVLNEYIYESDKELDEINEKYSHLIENYEEHMLDDVLQEDDFGLALMDAFNVIDKWSKR